MEVVSAFITDRGRKRKLNEDSFLANDWLGVYVVCDGMGGHACGDVASQSAVEVLKAKLELAKKGNRKVSPAKSFLDAVQLANRAVWEMSSGAAACRSMGTTIAAVMVLDDTCVVAHVGDSRVYRIRDGAIAQLTRDHSLVEEEVMMGIITKAEAKTSSKRNVITRALGLKEEVEIESKEYEIKKGDFLLLCSDGLTGMVEDEDILKIIMSEGAGNLNKAVSILIEHANLNGGDDNITAVLLYFK
ncbi:MAG: Stp1/IreP family PP2C-type Ser/Thr phosphatase [Thermodesulfobacteriota bacterium]